MQWALQLNLQLICCAASAHDGDANGAGQPIWLLEGLKWINTRGAPGAADNPELRSHFALVRQPARDCAQAAVPLSPSVRDRYLKIVTADLAEAERVDDATVKAVVETCSARWSTDETGSATAHRYDDAFAERG